MVEITQLENGIKVVIEKIPTVRSAAVGIWVKAGSVMENKKNNGVSHFLEHMIFKGTANRTAKKIAEDMSAIGGHINAFTAKECTCYYAQTLDANIDSALDVLSDMIQNSLFREEDIEKEKEVVLDEIDMYEDSPEDLVHDMFQQKVWNNHPLGYNILGGKDNIRNMTRDDLVTYYNNNYTTDNIVISVAGNVDVQQILVTLNKMFNQINKKIEVKNHIITEVDYKPSFVWKDKDIEQVHLCMGYEGIHYNSDKIYMLAIMNSILGGSMDSRLFQGIREEKGLAYSIYSAASNYEEGGLLNIYAATNPMHIEEVIKEVRVEISTLVNKGISEHELAKTKEQLKSNYIIGLESTSSRMSNNGKSIMLLNRIKTQDEIINKINEVSYEDIIQFTKDILDNGGLSISLVGNENNFDVEKVETLWKN